METVSETLNRINELLRAHNEVDVFVCVRSRYAYDAKLRLRGPGFVTLKLEGLVAAQPVLPLDQVWLRISDVRSEQHDGVRYEISDIEEDRPLWRCRSLSVIAEGERLHLG